MSLIVWFIIFVFLRLFEFGFRLDMVCRVKLFGMCGGWLSIVCYDNFCFRIILDYLYVWMFFESLYIINDI